jgi:hypothetical protein
MTAAMIDASARHLASHLGNHDHARFARLAVALRRLPAPDRAAVEDRYATIPIGPLKMGGGMRVRRA